MIVLFYVTLAVAMGVVITSTLIISDPVQLVVHPPRAWSIALLKRRKLLMGIALAGFAISLAAGIINAIWPWPLLAVYGVFFLSGYFFVFLASEMVIFPEMQHSAEYRPVAEVSGVADDEDVFVVQADGEAYAFPREWIVRPHVAGVQLGGERVALAYCGLSHMALAFHDEVDGRPMHFRTASQFENNLVLRDRVSDDIVQLIYGKLIRQDRLLDQVPVTTMPFGAFKSLYPGGQVFYHPPQGVLDRTIRRALNGMLNGKGGQYDPESPDLIFKTVSYQDRRVPPKEMVYGLSHGDEAVAYTVPYLKAHDNVVVETVGDQQVTVKYFETYDFVDVFAGDAADVGPTGLRGDGTKAERLPHAGKLMWMIWRNFYPDTAVRLAN